MFALMASLQKTMTICFIVSLIVLAPFTLRAQTEESGAPASTQEAAQNTATTAGPQKDKSGKRTSVNFEDELVEGQTQKPELFYLLQQRNANFKRLIKLRDNFLPEMRKTSEGVGVSGQAKGSGN